NGELRTHKILVSNAAVEIDAGFEGDRVWLLEAKARETQDFMIRQLYYPLRLWQSKISKPIVPLFFVYTNRVFGIYEYHFDNEKLYQSVRFVRSHWFTFDEPKELPSLATMFDTVKRAQPPEEVPFPQAD